LWPEKANAGALTVKVPPPTSISEEDVPSDPHPENVSIITTESMNDMNLLCIYFII
jgi:hypothetical protein